jgi:hypothetical protein
MISTPSNGCLFGVWDVVQLGIYIDVVIACPMHLGEMNCFFHIALSFKFDYSSFFLSRLASFEA